MKPHARIIRRPAAPIKCEIETDSRVIKADVFDGYFRLGMYASRESRPSGETQLGVLTVSQSIALEWARGIVEMLVPEETI